MQRWGTSSNIVNTSQVDVIRYRLKPGCAVYSTQVIGHGGDKRCDAGHTWPDGYLPTQFETCQLVSKSNTAPSGKRPPANLVRIKTLLPYPTKPRFTRKQTTLLGDRRFTFITARRY